MQARLNEIAKLAGVDPRVYLPRATEAAIAVPGTITLREALWRSNR